MNLYISLFLKGIAHEIISLQDFCGLYLVALVATLEQKKGVIKMTPIIPSRIEIYSKIMIMS